MAKDKKQKRPVGDIQNTGRDDAKKTARSQDIDVSSGSLEGKESDSELDIQALLRKYMPEYDSEEEEPESEGAGVLSRLKRSAEDMSDEEVFFDLPADEAAETEEDSVLSALDAAFTELMTEEPLREEKTPAQKLEADDFMFTDDIPAQMDDGEVEDEEGIYEDDDDRYSRKPRRK